MSPAPCMTVINTSPAIHLHAVLPGGLGSLAGLIGEVIVPWEVGQELAAGHAKDATWQGIQSLPGMPSLPSCGRPSPALSADRHGRGCGHPDRVG